MFPGNQHGCGNLGDYRPLRVTKDLGPPFKSDSYRGTRPHNKSRLSTLKRSFLDRIVRSRYFILVALDAVQRVSAAASAVVDMISDLI